jgi:2-oxoglutarate dehydrogenase E2 component (dihydrolipoamide succinyltransferase)
MLPTMSGQQCLRRLPAAMRSVRALRASPRVVPAARAYSAVSKANQSGLLGQASKWVPRMPPHHCAPLTSHRRPGQLSSQRLWTLEQTRSYAETIVKVPEMAESITEGTLKQWSKRAFLHGVGYGPANNMQRLETMLSRTRKSRPSRPTRSTSP